LNEKLRDFVERRPVLAYVLLCYGITWTVWFCIPLVAGSEWTLVKILTGVALGPGLAGRLARTAARHRPGLHRSHVASARGLMGSPSDLLVAFTVLEVVGASVLAYWQRNIQLSVERVTR